MAPEPLSIVVLTKDESENLPECLDALLAQLGEDDEVLVVDAASSDGTVDVALRYEQKHPGTVRLLVSDDQLSFGAARNIGIKLARHDVIGFVSADATPEPGWLDAMRHALRNADIVYGRQRHAPTATNVATVARGLRYHLYEVNDPDRLPERFASNVNAVYRRMVFDELRFDEALPGVEDLAFAKEARYAGYRIAYTRDAVVRHKDVADWKSEWRKNVSRGAAYARLRNILDAPVGHLAWAFAVGGLALLTVITQSALMLAGTFVVFFAPTIRRLLSPAARRYSAPARLAGALVSPLFDVAFVASYLRRRTSW